MSDKETMELTKLDGANYPIWKFGVMIALKAKDLYGIVDGTVLKPEATEAAQLKNYEKQANQASMIILTTVSRDLHCNLINCSTPSEMWQKLKTLYSDTSADAKQSAWEDFYSFRLNEKEPIAVQLERFECIRKKLEDAGDKPSEPAVLSRLLSSLPTKFSIFRIAWECTPAGDRSIENLTSRLIREDKRISEDESTLALHVQKCSISDGQRKKKKKDIEELKKRTHCGICKEKGHWARECPKKKKYSDTKVKSASAFVGDVAATLKCTSDDDSDAWIAHSGAGMHMSFHKSYFSSLKPNTNGYKVRVADDRVIEASGIGIIKIQEEIEGCVYERNLQDVLYVPQLKCNLFSIGSTNRMGYSYHSYGDRCEILDAEGKVAARGVPHGSLFKMLFKVKMPDEFIDAQLADGQNALKLWHARMSHANARAVKHTCEQFGIDGLAPGKTEFFCEGCVLGKQSRRPHRSTEGQSIYGPGEKIHSDVCGPINVESPNGSRYFLVLKDESTSFRKVYFLRHKSEVYDKFREFEAFVRTQVGSQIKILRSDNGTEYTCGKMQQFIKEKGIIHERSSAYIHEQNGRAEREIRTLVESARSMILERNVSRKLCPEAINTACYTLNRTILKYGEVSTPFEKWYKKKPSIKHLRVFGAQAYLNVPKEKRHKFDPKSRPVIHVGYDGESSNYRLWDEASKKILISSDVIFNEGAMLSTKSDAEPMTFGIDFEDQEEPEVPQQPPAIEDDDQAPPEEEERQQDDDHAPPEEERQQDGHQAPPEDRVAAIHENPHEGRQLRNRNRIPAPDRYGFPVAYLVDTVSISYDQAVSSDRSSEWKNAMDEEMRALEENRTWTLSALPPGKRVIGCRWVFDKKTDAVGNVKRYKARLVAKGFRQREGIDYFDTFAPVVRYESIRILLALAAKEDLEIMKFDIKTAFLYGDLKEEIHLEQPSGYKNKVDPTAVLKLHRSLYGLKQSPKCWNQKFSKFLTDFNLVNISSDKCVYIGVVDSYKVYLALYVDDGLVMSESMNAIESVLDYLKSNFKITTDQPNDFLGFAIERDRKKRTIKISQSGYISKMLKKFNMLEANAIGVPAEPSVYILKREETPKQELPYREAVGSLAFAARVSPPDIEFAVNHASQFLSCYNESHWQSVKKIMRYLNGTRDLGICYGNSGSSVGVIGFTDADYAGCTMTRKSRSGFVFCLNGAPISWSSQLQKVVAVSTAESEYIALFHGVKEAVWLRRFLSELDISSEAIPIFVDNQAAIKIAGNAEDHKRTKHIDIKFHFTRDILNRGEIEIEYVRSSEQLADLFTKPLTKPQFSYLREKLNVIGH